MDKLQLLCVCSVESSTTSRPIELEVTTSLVDRQMKFDVATDRLKSPPFTLVCHCSEACFPCNKTTRVSTARLFPNLGAVWFTSTIFPLDVPSAPRVLLRYLQLVDNVKTTLFVCQQVIDNGKTTPFMYGKETIHNWGVTVCRRYRPTKVQCLLMSIVEMWRDSTWHFFLEAWLRSVCLLYLKESEIGGPVCASTDWRSSGTKAPNRRPILVCREEKILTERTNSRETLTWT